MHERFAADRVRLEPAEWITSVEVFEYTAGTVGGIPSAGAPLTAAPTTGHASFRRKTTGRLLVAQGVVNKGFHADCAHGVEEVSAR